MIHGDVDPVLVFQDHVFVGSSQAAENWHALRYFGITHVFSAIGPTKTACEGIVYASTLFEDSPGESLDIHIERYCLFYDQVMKANGRVLVHCQAGISRSVALIMASLMLCHGLNYDDAFGMIRERRRRASPNLGFCTQLLDLQRRINNKI